MRAEARRQLRDLRWLSQAENYRRQLLADIEREPDNRQLHGLLRMVDEVIAHERCLLLTAESAASEPAPAISRSPTPLPGATAE